tara:strand:- start:11686 stop:12324 length:639 start_codon:yes stop_codon:yes gene_type:complete
MNNNKIGIYNYYSSNSFSLKSALDKISVDYLLSDDFDKISECQKIIIPGIGNMKNLLSNIDRETLKEKIENYIKIKKGTIYGICLGMQILLNSSSEGNVKTLEVIKGHTVALEEKFKKNLNVGYRLINLEESKFTFKNLFKGINNPKLYFLHKYYCLVDDANVDKIYIKQDNQKILAGLYKNKILGTQFHPELSGKNGLIFLKNFCNHSFNL